jgi:hypothetical protein
MVRKNTALASSDVDVGNGVGGNVAEVRHGVGLTPLHVRTDRRGVRWRRPYLHAIIGSHSSRFASCGRH